MKKIFATLALIALAFTLASCNKASCTCDCSLCNPNGSDGTIQRPGDSGNGNNGGTTDEVDRSSYTVYSSTMTKGQATYYGQAYQGQPATTANWYIELADANYELDQYSGTGFNISLEFFTSSSYTTSIPTGNYTVEAFNENEFPAYSLLYGFVSEEGSYPLGTWLFEGNEALAAATAGAMTVEKSGSTYKISYELHDDEYQITFKGTFSGSLTIYDGTQESSYVSAASARKNANSVKHCRIRK